MQVNYPIRFTEDGFHQFRDDYKKSSIQGTHVTYEHGLSHALVSAHIPYVLESISNNDTKGSDILTNSSKMINEKVTKVKPFNYASLFSGIGGFEQALNKLGGNCVLASEIDKFANQAYETLYGHATVGDITKVKAEDVPDHDVLVGGFPCQAFSVAGKRGGFEDARGTLFFEMARIAKEKQPKMFLAENVKGLLSHDKGRTMDTIVTTLSDIGYRVDFEVLNSKYFGVPQNRERVFIIGIREDLLENEMWEIPKGSTVVPKAKRRLSEYGDLKTFNFDWPAQDDVLTRLKDVLEAEVDEKYYLSEDKTAKLVAQLEEREQVKSEPPSPLNLVSRGAESRGDGVAYALKAAEGGSSKQHILEDYPKMLGHVDIKGHDAIKRVYSAEGVSPTLTTMGGGHREPKTAVQERQRYRIRKLTPLECWRLQGFPDEAHEAVKAAGISDSQRYKQAGNAVTVNVIEAIGERLLPYLG